MSKTALAKRCLVSTLVLALPQYGCVSRQLAPTVVSYNLAVEHAQNEVLLLNAIRAEHHLPMYLTDISKITGSIRRDITGTVALPFGHLLHAGRDSAGIDTGSAVANGTATPGATYSVNPTFDVNVLNTQDFMRGFLKPVDTQTFSYYWDQAYPPELLLHLFVLRVEVADQAAPKENVAIYENHPYDHGDNKDLRCFSQWVTWFLDGEARPHTVTIPKVTGIGPPLERKVVGLKELIAASARDELTLEPSNPKDKDHPQYQLKSTKTEIQLSSRPQTPFNPVGCHPKTGPASAARASDLHAEAVADKQKEKITFQLRSPEGILYYLGQILRLEHFNGAVSRIKLEGRDELFPIFVALQKHPAGGSPGTQLNCPSFVDVTDSLKDRYIIPRQPPPPPPENARAPEGYLAPLSTCDPGFSMTSLNIVSQLIGLQKAAKDFPTTSVVRTIGGQ